MIPTPGCVTYRFRAVRVLQHEGPVVFVRGDISRVHGVERTEKLFEDVSLPVLGRVGWDGGPCTVGKFPNSSVAFADRRLCESGHTGKTGVYSQYVP